MGSFWKSHFLTLILVAIDVVAFSLIWRESWELRRSLDSRFSDPINDFSFYRAQLPKLLLVWTGVMAYCRLYAHRGKISSLNQMRGIFQAGAGFVVGTLAVTALITSTIESKLGRSVILIACAEMTLYVYLSRTALRMIKERFVRRGYGLTRAAIIGAGDLARQVGQRIRHHPEIGYALVGFIDRAPGAPGREIDGVPVIGATDQLVDLLLRYRVEEVFLAEPGMSTDEKFNMITEAEQTRVHFKLVTGDVFQVITESVKIDDIGDMPVIVLPERRLDPFSSLLKRALDLTIAIPSLVIVAPVVLVLCALIKLDSPGSPFFIQNRIGKDGRTFRMYKLRTMRQDVDPYKPAPEDVQDPRVTHFGRFLRRSSLDELPQMLNVIKGEMSVVGPRPEMPFIVEQYQPWQRRRLDVPQGITGLWQIAGRKRLPLHMNLEYDFYYIRNWSLLLDLVIMFKTIPSVLFGRGAF